MAALVLAAVLMSPGALSAATMSAGQAARTLGDMREGYRQNAIAVLARGGQLASPLSASDGAALLEGTTQAALA